MSDRTADPLAVSTPGDGWDPVTATAVIIGRKWHPVILHRLLTHGPLGFNDLAGRIDGLSNKVLSACLDDLEDAGLVSREIVNDRPFRVAYDLTPVGETLEPVLEAMAAWGETAVERTMDPKAADVSVPR